MIAYRFVRGGKCHRNKLNKRYQAYDNWYSYQRKQQPITFISAFIHSHNNNRIGRYIINVHKHTIANPHKRR